MHSSVLDHALFGVRQGCVLSPRLSCAALELAMSEWRLANPHGGVDFGDAMPRLLNLRFADDILLFANTKEEVQNLLDSLVRHLAAAGLVLNTSKTVALSTEAQPPSFIQVGDSHVIKVLGYSESHKWLGCMLCASPGLDSDVEYHLQQAAKAFQKHRWMLQCKDCFIKHRLRYFEAVVFSTACFAAKHQPLYRKHLEKYDVQFRKLVRCIAGPSPAPIDQHNGMIFCTTRGSLVPCQRNFFLVNRMHDSILEFRFLHCKFTCRTLGAEDTCMETTSNISSAWTPATNLGHEMGNVLHVPGFGQLGKCCENYGPMGLSFAVFPGFLLHVLLFSTLCEKCL